MAAGETGMERTEVRILFCTCGADQAEALAEALVGERLVACVNALAGARSTYRWEGRIEHDEEVVLLMETRDTLVDAAVERLRALHAYDVPKIVVLDPERVDPAYRDWVVSVTGSDAGSDAGKA